MGRISLFSSKLDEKEWLNDEEDEGGQEIDGKQTVHIVDPLLFKAAQTASV